MADRDYHSGARVPSRRVSRLTVLWYRIRVSIGSKMAWMKGEWFCSFWHTPLWRDIGGCGGRDVWGRRRKQYWGLRCSVCRNQWETTRPAKLLTRRQERAIADALGNMWVGHNGDFRPSDVSEDDIEAISERIGMYPGAWDMVEPKEIIASCWTQLVSISGEHRAKFSS